jgi:hypothetical protein
MDKELELKIAEARANGYTDEQINSYLNAEPTERLDQKKDESGVPVSPFVDRGEEAIGTAQYAAAEAAKYATVAGGGYYGAKKIAQALRGPAVPTAGVPTAATVANPTTFTGGANQAFDQALSKPYAAPAGATAAPMAPANTGIMSQIGSKFAPLAQRVAPVLQGASKLLAPAAVASELFYTSPEDQAQLKQMEQSGTTLKDYTKQKLGMAPRPQPQANNQARLDQMIREAAAKRALAFPNQ